MNLTDEAILERGMPNRTLGVEKRLTSKGRAKRDRIIESAAALIFAAGARETTLDDVRSAAGASKSQLYHYFADKDELLNAVIEYQGDRVIRAQQPELAAIDSVASLRRWRDKLVKLANADGTIGGCPIGSLANELAGLSEAHGKALQVHFDNWAEQIKEGLLRMRVNGCLEPPLDPTNLSIAILAAIQGGLLFAKLQRSSAGLGVAIDQIIGSIETACRQSRSQKV